jgi:hypothetical protein
MPNAVLFVGWGTTIPGREQKALQVFNDTMQYYQRLKQEGAIQDFQPVQLEPHGGDLEGFALLQGERDKLNQLRYSPEFIHNVNRAALVVQNVGVVMGYAGEELNRLFSDYQSQINELG